MCGRRIIQILLMFGGHRGGCGQYFHRFWYWGFFGLTRYCGNVVTGGDPFSGLCGFRHLLFFGIEGLLCLSVRERKYSADQGGDLTAC